MKIETYLFGGVALFFAVTSFGYAWWSDREPAGTAALIFAFIMSSLVCFFFFMQHRRRGTRPEDHKDAEVQQRSGPLDFFPPHSGYPLLTAVGFTVAALGVVYGAWLFLIGVGLLGSGVFGFVFQFGERDG
ncbi:MULTISPECIES: cytochrome c oxidase subunit 4 [unclassified Streptomyces]|uniref:aa3-type cytochrome oxidase subunit IV n=1 Tax=unclassified Streptomyces TaxID=2593676 RepID=UPI00380CF935